MSDNYLTGFLAGLRDHRPGCLDDPERTDDYAIEVREGWDTARRLIQAAALADLMPKPDVDWGQVRERMGGLGTCPHCGRGGND